jgi:hypothetical protein
MGLEKTSQDQVTKWLERCAEQSLARVEVWLARGDALVRNIGNVKAATRDADNLAKVAAGLQLDCENHGSSQSGQWVTYALLPFDANGDKLTEFFVRVTGGNARGVQAPGPGDVQDLMAVVGHLLKANNDQAQIIIKAYANRDEVLLKQLHVMSDALRDSEKLRGEALAMQQRHILLETEQRALSEERARAERKEEWLLGKAELWLPMIMNRALGGGVAGKGNPASGPLMEGIFSAMTSDDVNAFMDSGVNPEIKAAFGELYNGFIRRKHTALNAPPASGEPSETNGVSGKDKAS